MFKVLTSDKCAWRAAYFYWKNKKLGYLGVDPYNKNGMIGPRIFGGVGSHVFYCSIPYLNWRANMGTFSKKIYQKQNSFWHKVDGRQNR